MTKNYWAFIKRLYARFNVQGVDKLGDLGVLQYKHTLISHAEILKLRASPVILLPGRPGFLHVPQHIFLTIRKPTTYTETADNLAFTWLLGNADINFATQETTAFVSGNNAQNSSIIQPFSSILANIHFFNGGSRGLMGRSIRVRNGGNGEFGGGAIGNYMLVVLAYLSISEKELNF